MGKRLSKYVSALDCFDKTLIVLSGISGGGFSISLTSFVGVPSGIISASFTLVFALTIRITKTVLEIKRNKKTNIIKYLCLLKENQKAVKL